MKTTISIFILALTATIGLAQTNLTALLQQGMLEEQANRNLDAAVSNYQALAAQFDQNRQLAATAIFRLGECYRMQGRTNEAADQYHRIVNEFSDQSTLVTLSRQNLVGLGTAPSNRTSEAMQIAQVKAQDDARAAAVTTTEQDQEIQRIQRLLQDSPDLVNAPGGDLPLLRAAAAGWPDVVNYLLDHGAKIDAAYTDGYTALHKAAAAGNKAMVKLLLDRGADVNAKTLTDGTPLVLAAKKGYQLVAEVLLANKAEVNVSDSSGKTPLDYAAQTGALELSRSLLAAGADPNLQTRYGQTPLSYAAGNSEAIVKALLDAKADPNLGLLDLPLFAAVFKNDLGSAERLLQAGADPNAVGKVDYNGRGNMFAMNASSLTPLWMAACFDRPAMVQLLLKYKADPDGAQTEGKPVIFSALSNTNILEILLNGGADPNARNNSARDGAPQNTTPLIEMASGKSLLTLKILLKHGADVNARNNWNVTALHRAVFEMARTEEHWRFLEDLLDHKADPNVRDERGSTPLDYVRGWPDRDARDRAIALLHQHGALDNLPDWQTIRYYRSTTNTPEIAFQKGTNDWNRFTLMELVANRERSFTYDHPQYMPRPGSSGLSGTSLGSDFLFPDLNHLVIVRPQRDGKAFKRIPVNLLDATNGIDCANDVTLEFGDRIEIPERPHKLSEQDTWTRNQIDLIKKCLKARAGEANLIVTGGQTITLPLKDFESSIVSILRSGPAQEVLTSSSDLSRVKITHRDPASGKKKDWILDCRETGPDNDLKVRDGDVIEVPQKP